MIRWAFITGTRAEYGLLAPVARAARERDLEIEWIVCGQHLSADHGNTVEFVERDGSPIAGRVPTLDPADSNENALSRAVSRGVLGITEALDDGDFDAAVVLGDRTEAFAGAVAASLSGRIVAHIHGGDLSGGHDESMRHATTKFSHLHFAASPASARRILQLGEDPNCVHVVGAPGLDVCLSEDPLDREALSKALRARSLSPLPSGPFLVVIQHPDSRHAERAANAMVATLDAVERTGLPVYIASPNSDPGGREMRAAIESHAVVRNGPGVLFDHLDHREYLSLVGAASALVGNSSSGIIEAPSLGTPVVDIGSRQANRERATTVVHVIADDDAPSIEAAVRRAIDGGRVTAENPYGDGNAAPRIAEILADARVRELRATKHFHEIFRALETPPPFERSEP